MINIKKTTKERICNGCGVCSVVCPKLAIEVSLNDKKGSYGPEIINDKCDSCGICLKVCPAMGLNSQNNNLLGNYIASFVGFANNEEIRYNASSGGAITALLVFALEKGLINGAVVTRFAKDNILTAESFIARTKEEIIAASQSKYCPVAMDTILKEIISSAKSERLAFVGLPCQISAIREASKINIELRKKIVFYVGLFCGFRPNFNGLKFFLEKNNINKEEIKEINYRGSGWPGFVKILKKNGEVVNFSFPSYWSVAGSSFFYPKSCMACTDCTSERADLSFGDAWLKEFKDDKIGHSIIICRTEKGNTLLGDAKEAGILKFEKIPYKKVIQSQIINIYLKKKGLRALFPKKKLQGLEPDLLDSVLSLFFLFNSIIGEKKISRKFLSFIPLRIISLYTGFLGKFWRYKAERGFKEYIN